MHNKYLQICTAPLTMKGSEIKRTWRRRAIGKKTRTDARRIQRDKETMIQMTRAAIGNSMRFPQNTKNRN
jgi:hypothetical protein